MSDIQQISASQRTPPASPQREDAFARREPPSSPKKRSCSEVGILTGESIQLSSAPLFQRKIKSEHALTEHKKLIVARWLTKNGFATDLANFNTVNADGWTPLECAINANDLGIVKNLVELGADIHHQDAFGWTPLRRALFCKRSDIVAWLEEKEAKRHIDDDLFFLYQKLINIESLCSARAPEQRTEFLKRPGASFLRALSALNDLFDLHTAIPFDSNLGYQFSAQSLRAAWERVTQFEWNDPTLKDKLIGHFNQLKLAQDLFEAADWKALSKCFKDGNPCMIAAILTAAEGESADHATVVVGHKKVLGFGNAGWQPTYFDRTKKQWTKTTTDDTTTKDLTYANLRRIHGLIFAQLTDKEDDWVITAGNLQQIHKELGLAGLEKLAFDERLDLLVKEQRKRGNCGSKAAKMGYLAQLYFGVVDASQAQLNDLGANDLADTIYKDLTLLQRGLELANFAIAADEDFIETSLQDPKVLIDEAFSEVVKFADRRTYEGKGDFSEFKGNVFTQTLKVLEKKAGPHAQYLRSKIEKR